MKLLAEDSPSWWLRTRPRSPLASDEISQSKTYSDISQNKIRITSAPTYMNRGATFLAQHLSLVFSCLPHSLACCHNQASPRSLVVVTP